MDSVIKETFNFQQNTAAEICSEKAAFLLNPLVRPCGVGKKFRKLELFTAGLHSGVLSPSSLQTLQELQETRSLGGPTFIANNVPDNIIMKVLRQRLDQQDCVERGWVLHGFPRDRDQARLMDGLGYKPNRFTAGLFQDFSAL
ncbi:hypothetical protein J1605_019639 [Eschrichtius robustus]|uniref:Nucleoside-diphosphate kinase n=1 Tax=Eschrichtius robustus TaxID=9764 RepID=A0AB34HNK0_ESCRO|nr:hypothetical protein J1605_019639 [Eschrichtius robustus]